MHGMMTSKGNPNLDRAARIILKDYVDVSSASDTDSAINRDTQGRLLYRHAPPSMEAAEFQSAADLPEEKRFKTMPKPSGAKSALFGALGPEIPVGGCHGDWALIIGC